MHADNIYLPVVIASLIATVIVSTGSYFSYRYCKGRLAATLPPDIDGLWFSCTGTYLILSPFLGVAMVKYKVALSLWRFVPIAVLAPLTFAALLAAIGYASIRFARYCSQLGSEARARDLGVQD